METSSIPIITAIIGVNIGGSRGGKCDNNYVYLVQSTSSKWYSGELFSYELNIYH